MELAAGIAYRCGRALTELASRLDPLTNRFRETELPDELVGAIKALPGQMTRINVGLRERDLSADIARGREFARDRGALG